MIDRRAMLKTTAGLTLLAPLARFAHALPDPDARFVLVILRGGLDGLAAVPPYGDGRYRSLRDRLALEPPGTAGGALRLDGLFALHPALLNLHEMFEAGELSVLHAVATPYRERSHFDGQKVLEAGGTTAETSAGGWLNRALGELARHGDKREGIALADAMPLVLRGDYPVTNWAPSRLPGAGDDTIERVRAIYEATDPDLAGRLAEALETRALAASGDGSPMGGRVRAQVQPLATAAARFLSSPDGPRVAVIDIGGWDTHANQGAGGGPLAQRLRGLDTGLAGLKTELGRHWQTTTVLVVTEFGRTAAPNGTGGTDHGTGTCAFLAGGAVNGGRVIADWPGLGSNELRDGRDLRATADLRAVFKGVLAERFGLVDRALDEVVFPGSEPVSPMTDL